MVWYYYVYQRCACWCYDVRDVSDEGLGWDVAPVSMQGSLMNQVYYLETMPVWVLIALFLLILGDKHITLTQHSCQPSRIQRDSPIFRQCEDNAETIVYCIENNRTTIGYCIENNRTTIDYCIETIEQQ